MGHSLCKSQQQVMRQEGRDQLWSYQPRHLCGKQSLLRLLQISGELLRQREHLRVLPTTFRCSQLLQRKVLRARRRLIDLREFRIHLEVRKVERKQFLQNMKGF